MNYLVSVPDGLMANIDEYIKQIREETGLKTTRSKLVQILLELFRDSIENIDLDSTVVDHLTLKREIASALLANLEEAKMD